jgi:hypothetical protein
MRRCNLIVAALGVAAAITLVNAVGASAKDLNLFSPAFGNVAAGNEVEADASTWSIDTSKGAVVCHETTGFDGLTGADVTNGAKADAIHMTKDQNGFYKEECENDTSLAGKVVVSQGRCAEDVPPEKMEATFKLGASRKAEYLTTDRFESGCLGLEWVGQCTNGYWLPAKMKGKVSVSGDLAVKFEHQKVENNGAYGSCPTGPGYYSVDFDAWWVHIGAEESRIEDQLVK